MIPSQDLLGQLAGRIERAYFRRHSQCKLVGITPGVWYSAASRLHEARDEDSSIPIDPELFVAAQPRSELRPDPWGDLTQSSSLTRYRKMIRRIVRKLQAELREEVRRANRALDRGLSLDQILSSESSRTSAMSRYILAHQGGRPDLESRFRAAALAQHQACPLYRNASRSLLPDHAYPAPTEEFVASTMTDTIMTFSLN